MGSLGGKGLSHILVVQDFVLTSESNLKLCHLDQSSGSNE